MPNWQSVAEITKDSLAFEKLIYALFGLYVWEIFQTCDFEWALLTQRRKFTWPMVLFYLLCRYCMLWALVGLIISFNVTTRINCEALYTFNSWTGNMAILCASTSLMIRTIAIWERRLVVVVPLLILCLAHWGLLYHGIIIVRASWDNTQNACVVTQTNSAVLKFTFFATMGFDFVIFVYTCTALLKNAARSGLWHLLFRDGLIYWAVSFCANAVPAILNSLNLNGPMNVIGTVPAATISAIAACRCVVRLQEFANKDVYVHSTSVGGAVLSGQAGAAAIARYGPGSPTIFARPEVHIRTDHITMETLSKNPQSSRTEFGSPITDKSPRDLEEGSDEEEHKIDRIAPFNAL